MSYAIVLSATGAQLDIYGAIDGRTANRYEWAGASAGDSPYADGAGLSYLGGVGWDASNVDYAFRTHVSALGYSATVGQPINADGSSVFKASRGVVPVKFTLSSGGSPTCALPAATISLTRTAGVDPGPITESTYLGSADSGSSFQISDCQYIYNLNAKSLGAGTYLVEISISSRSLEVRASSCTDPAPPQRTGKGPDRRGPCHVHRVPGVAASPPRPRCSAPASAPILGFMATLKVASMRDAVDGPRPTTVTTVAIEGFHAPDRVRGGATRSSRQRRRDLTTCPAERRNPGSTTR